MPILLLGILVTLLWKVIPWPVSLHDPEATSRPVTPRGALAESEALSIDIFESNRRSVVHIYTAQVREGRFGFRAAEEVAGAGSGFVWDAAGYVVTNYHVLQGASRAWVRLDQGDEREAAYVGGDASYDLAVLKIDPGDLTLRPVLVGESATLRVGQAVFAIGNPYQFDWTLTTGVVSGVDRVITSVARTPIDGVIQTDAAINPGNSGGPLLDSAGRLIGINTAIYSPSGTSAGIGFAVPVDTVNRVVPSIIAGTDRAGLGLRLASDESARRYNIVGAVVIHVEPGSAAERAGLRSPQPVANGGSIYDIIRSIDGNEVRSRTELERELRARRVGATVELEFERGRQRLRTTATLQSLS